MWSSMITMCHFTVRTWQLKSVVLINCGGCLNLLELLQPENEEVRFYVLDSRRPLELDNVYNQGQIVLVMREGDKLDVPEFDAIYSSDMVRTILGSDQTCVYDVNNGYLSCHLSIIHMMHILGRWWFWWWVLQRWGQWSKKQAKETRTSEDLHMCVHVATPCADTVTKIEEESCLYVLLLCISGSWFCVKCLGFVWDKEKEAPLAAEEVN